MKTKQTAVEYLMEILKERDIRLDDLRKAKSMEFNQIVDAYDRYPETPKLVLGEDYYRNLYGD